MRPLRRPLQRMLRRLPPVRQERLPVRRRMPSVPPSRPPQGRRLPPLPPRPRPPLPRPPSRLLPLRPDKGLTPTPTAREAPCSRAVLHGRRTPRNRTCKASPRDSETTVAPPAPRHTTHGASAAPATPPGPPPRRGMGPIGTGKATNADSTACLGTTKATIFRKIGPDLPHFRPRNARISAFLPPSEPRGGAAKRRRKAPTGVPGGQFAAKTTRAAAPCERKSLTNPNRPTAQKRQQRPQTPPTALKAPRALVIIFWKKPPPPRRRPRPIRAVRGAMNGVPHASPSRRRGSPPRRDAMNGVSHASPPAAGEMST